MDHRRLGVALTGQRQQRSDSSCFQLSEVTVLLSVRVRVRLLSPSSPSLGSVSRISVKGKKKKKWTSTSVNFYSPPSRSCRTGGGSCQYAQEDKGNEF